MALANRADARAVPAQVLIDAARGLVGVPFRHQGRTRTGVDCIGYLDLATRTAGVDVPALLGVTVRADYSRAAQPGLLGMFMEHGVRVPAPIPGAVLLFRFTGAAYPQHAAIYSERDTLLHAYARPPVLRVVESGYRGAWVRWTHSVWRVAGVDYG